MTSQPQLQDQQNPLLNAIVTRALQPNNHELLRHLSQVLDLRADEQVLLISDAGDDARAILQDEFGCRVDVFQGDIRALPFEAGRFDSAIVAVPVTREVHAVARELSRVLKPNGSLGMVVFSVYRDQMPDDAQMFSHVMPLIATSRPAAAYRAVLAECGFTAFVSEDRRRDLQRTALGSYRHHMLQATNEAQVQSEDAVSQALGLLATGGVGITLITAEKVL